MYSVHRKFPVLPDELIAFAWSKPMRDLAAEVGLSDVGLKKLLRSQGIVTPPQGYWNRVHAGRSVPKRPEAGPRPPGGHGRIMLDGRFAKVLTAARPIDSGGPFASAAVPENLDQLYAQELTAIGRAGVPRLPERAHPAIQHILQQEQRRREKSAAGGWSSDAPKFDSPFHRRRLRILNAVFLALGRRGHGADAYERDGEIHATATVGDTRLGLDIGPAARQRRGGRISAALDWPASTPLALSVDVPFDGTQMQSWQDDSEGKLENRIAEITARIIVAGEARFRRSLKEAEEHAEQLRCWEEQRCQEEIARRNAERLEQLRTSGALLRQAEDLRTLIRRVRGAVISGSVGVDSATLESWERWASAEADRLDPVLSGQIRTHLGDDHRS